MYDELIKRLRDAAKMSEALAVLLPHSEGNETAKLYREAADAIEELATNYDAATDIMKHQTEYCEYAAAMRCSAQNGRGYAAPTVIETEEGE